MKFLITYYFILILLANNSLCFSEGGWFQQLSNTNVDLNKIYFLNQDTGWVVGNSGKILKTTNGGIDWIAQQSNLNSVLRSVFFLNKDTGYITGGNYTPLTFSYVDIIKTTNGGNNWSILYSQLEFYNSASDVSFINANTGFVTCFGGNESESVGLLFKTTNSGINWNRSEYRTSFVTINFISENTGLIVSNYYSDVLNDSLVLYRSGNSGNDWTSIYSLTKCRVTSSMFLNSNTGWITGLYRFSGNSDLMLKTTNGGLNWENFNLTTLSFINSVFFSSNDTGWYCSSGIFKSINSGANWINQVPSNGTDTYNSIFFIDNSTGWSVGTNGKILKTVTGGLTSVSQSGDNIPIKHSLLQNYPNPFNPVTHLEFGISDLEFVSLKIYDVLGNEIKTLVNEIKSPGVYDMVFDGSNLSSGIYFYKLTAGKFSEVKKMSLLK